MTEILVELHAEKTPRRAEVAADVCAPQDGVAPTAEQFARMLDARQSTIVSTCGKQATEACGLELRDGFPPRCTKCDLETSVVVRRVY